MFGTSVVRRSSPSASLPRRSGSGRKANRRRRTRRPAAFRAMALEGRVLPSGILVVGAGRGAPPQVQVFDAATGKELFQFLAYSPRFRGGVSVAVGDLLGDGGQEIVTAPGPGRRSEVKVYRG